jgi:di/tricarboxylate transporter
VLAPVIDALTPLVAAASPPAPLYTVMRILTEFVTNNADVRMSPIAAAAPARSIPALFVAVTLAASARFTTPLSYQTNTLVDNSGDCRFRDFLRLGVPMTCFLGATTVLLIPRIWPLIPS